MKKGLISKIFVILLVVGLLFAAAPTRQTQAASFLTHTGRDPSIPSPADDVTVWIQSDTTAVETVHVEYVIGGVSTEVAGQKGTGTVYPLANWFAVIPAQPLGTTVTYQLIVRGEGGAENRRSANYSYTVVPGEVFVDDDFNSGTAGWDVTHFSTIQQGINAVSTYGKVNVYPGTYAERLTINKPLSLLGPNANIDPNTQVRGAEAQVVFPAGLTLASSVITVTANNVTINGLLLDGSALPATLTGKGIESKGDHNAYSFNIIQNMRAMGIHAQAKTNPALPSNDITVSHNLVMSTEESHQTRIGLMIHETAGLVDQNVLDNMLIGIEIYPRNYTVVGTVSNNVISTYNIGLYMYSSNVNGADWAFRDNTVTGVPIVTAPVVPVTTWRGIFVDAKRLGSEVFIGNTIDPGTADAAEIYNYDEGTIYAPATTNPAATAANNNFVTNVMIERGSVLLPRMYVKIADALAAAVDGDTILVGPGTYYENVVIDKPNITLKATGTAAETIINANKGFGVYILKDLGVVTIDGFTVKGWETAGIVQGTANRPGTTSRILNNIVIGETGDENHGNGIQVTGDNSLIEGNTVSGAYYIGSGPYGASGIMAYAANNVIIRNNTVSGADIGISVGAGRYHNLGPSTGVVVEGNEVFNTEIGISVTFAANNTLITGNYVHDNLTGLNEEYYLGEGPSGTVATGNRVVNNGEQATVTPTDDTPIPDDHIFNASPNWWGSAFGPGDLGEKIIYTPWCANEECTKFAPATLSIDNLTGTACDLTTEHSVYVNIADANDVNSFSLVIDFDPTILQVTKVEKGTFLGANVLTPPGNGFNNETGNMVWAIAKEGSPGNDGDGTLIKISFKLLKPGPTAFTIDAANSMITESWDSLPIPFMVDDEGGKVSFEPVVANITDLDNIKGYCDLATAVGEAESGDVLQLQANIPIPATVTVNKALTLDLNGKVATAATGIDTLNVTTGGALVINDSGTTGKITGGNRAARVNGGGSLVLNKGTLEGPGFDGVFVYNNGSSLTVNDGTITGLYYGISGNGAASGQYAGTPTIIINGGTVQGGETAIFHPQAGLLQITGGNIIGGSYNGIEMKGGELVITGGTITTDAAFVETPGKTANGNTQSGDAILIYNRAGYPGTMTVTISGDPVITSTHGYAVREYTFAGESSRTTLIDVTGGSFTGGLATGDAGEAVTFATLDEAVLKLTGGKYNTDPDAYTFAPYAGYFDSADDWWKIGQIAGTIMWDRNQTGKVSETDPIVTVNDDKDTIIFDGKIAWYKAEAIAPTQYQGNWVGSEIHAPVGFDTSETYINIFGADYKWDTYKDGVNYMFNITNPSWVMTHGGVDVYTVTWKPGLVQTFKLIITDESELMDPPAPIISSTDIQGYYLTGEAKEFNIAVENPTTGADYALWTFDYQVPGIVKSDIAKFEYFAVDLGSAGEWIDMGERAFETYLECDLNNDGTADAICGQFGWAPGGFGPAPAGFTGTSQFRITFANGFEVPLNFTVELKGKETSGSAWKLLQTYTGTMDVYKTPVITAAELSGPFQAGVKETVTINVDDVVKFGDPNNFKLHLNVPDGTVVTYGGVTCTAAGGTGCVFDLTLAVGDNALDFEFTFNSAYEGPVVITLKDDANQSGRVVATKSIDVVVIANITSVTGSVTLQGQTNKAGVPATLTGTLSFGPYPTVSTVDGTLVFLNLASDTYTFTTAQPRYLNVVASLNKTKLIAADGVVLTPIRLLSGNAIWCNTFVENVCTVHNTKIDINDASKVTDNWTTLTDQDADVNFDGKINIQDLALVGSNMGMESEDAYGSWMP